ncbi:MAG TPA: tRNA lysidine(34) synthetase TilS [Candidatus Cybelea sp.]|nr:tRNA lysidine(34) synthetase TilS [Candidatus Cybelea sp.]
MRTRLEQSVLEYIRSERLLSPGDRVAVAVSGGGDSVALLRILERIRVDLGVTLAVVHFEHGLRGADSELDAQFVADLARSHGLEFILEGADVAAEARRKRWNLEDAARRLRYSFFKRLIDEGRATRLAVAHTADDQAETVLAHIIRGTGPTGLAGIYPLTDDVRRPLLSIRRQDLRDYLVHLGQPWREDSTNTDQRRLRARVRAQLLPALERGFSPRAVRHLCDLARLSREEQIFWSALVGERFEALVRAAGSRLEISTNDLLDPYGSWPRGRGRKESANAESSPWRALSERLLRRIYEALRGDCRGLASRHVAQLIRLCRDSTSGHQVALPGGIVVERVFNDLVFSRSSGVARRTGAAPICEGYRYILDIPGKDETVVSVPEMGVRFRLKLVDWTQARSETNSDSSVLDADSVRAPLILRNWHPGDAYTPCGRRQPRKLKQMFLAARVPSGARRTWPLLESAGRVIWVRGMPLAEGFRASDRTRIGMRVEEDPVSAGLAGEGESGCCIRPARPCI